tara:strand:- start:292 stop:525 length:234 start_codon:yes stop_codon:yes gene_type:complete
MRNSRKYIGSDIVFLRRHELAELISSGMYANFIMQDSFAPWRNFYVDAFGGLFRGVDNIKRPEWQLRNRLSYKKWAR